MREFQRRLIEDAGRSCAAALTLAEYLERQGCWMDAAYYYEQAERDARVAFAVAEYRHG